jgi:toxin secretion/phage lysis holin
MRGIYQAWVFSSEGEGNPLLRYTLCLVLVFAAAQVDKAMSSGTFLVRDATVWFYLANEGLSILENMTFAGVPFPKRIKDLLGQIKDQHDSDSDKIE